MKLTQILDDCCRFVLPAAIALLIGFSCVASTLSAASDDDKRPLEHEDYAKWSSVRGQNISNDGKWISYSLIKGESDTTLKIREVATAKEYSVANGRSARFSFDSKFVIYTIAPDPELIKKLRKEKKPASEMPKSKLEILNLQSGKHVTIKHVGGFSMPDKAAGWLAFKIIEDPDTATVTESKTKLTETYEITPEGVERKEKEKNWRKEKEEKPEGEKESSEESKEKSKEKAESKESTPEESPSTADKKSDKKKKEKAKGTTLVIRNPNTHIEQRFPFVVNFRFSEDGKSLAFTTSAESGEEDGVYVVDLEKMETKQVLSGLGNYGQVVFSKDGRQIAFLTDRDDYESDEPSWALYQWKKGQKEARKLVDPETKGMIDGWWIASTSAPLFTEDGKRILFNTRPKPEPEEDDKEGEDKDPVVNLDIWHWQDPFLQPQQLLQAQRERNRSYRALYDISARKMIQLATKEIPNVMIDPRARSNIAVGIAPDKYNKMRSWDIQAYNDSYLIDLKTGKPRLLMEMSRGTPSLSPGGKFVTWWDGEQETWFALPTRKPGSSDEKAEPVDLGAAIKHPLQNELHDTPSLPGPYGTAGWLDDDEGLLIYDRWDIWQVDPSGKGDPVCITSGEGREQEIRFRNVRLDREQRTVDLKQPRILSAHVHSTKASGYYELKPSDKDDEEKEGTYSLRQLIRLDENVAGLRKAKNTNDVMLTRSTFERSPDLWASTLEFKTMRRISRMNPQQNDYIWGTAELVHWKADDGQDLDGLLYKPEDFDPDKEYPLMVYFYERNSDNLHTYYTPAAGRSIINFSFYVSRGYVIFVPDIPYTTGEPGPSAANAILPGVRHIVEQGYIDEKRIGMQGHSWGGYQTAYLVTVTDMFACAESGAPVSNMTSAYGGIRWGTGMSRMFQYEKTQSRIGDTLWNAREKYIANSPLFFADKINTPLLILHNDKDTAVPWYQGIELFVALRRLEKPSWMLNYNGDPHWVMSDENRMDFAKRMQQFFDHYMKGEPIPVWMAEGIPAVKKGKEFGFEYVKEKEEEAIESEGEETED